MLIGAAHRQGQTWNATRRHRLRLERRNRTRLKLHKRLEAQALAFNREGGPRTSDHVMPVQSCDNGLRAGRGNGPGHWKSSTPEFICKMAYPPLGMNSISVEYEIDDGTVHKDQLIAKDVGRIVYRKPIQLYVQETLARTQAQATVSMFLTRNARL